MNVRRIILRNRTRLSKLALYKVEGDTNEGAAVQEEKEQPKKKTNPRIVREGMFQWEPDDDEEEDEDYDDDEEESVEDEDLEIEIEEEEFYVED